MQGMFTTYSRRTFGFDFTTQDQAVPEIKVGMGQKKTWFPLGMFTSYFPYRTTPLMSKTSRLNQKASSLLKLEMDAVGKKKLYSEIGRDLSAVKPAWTTRLFVHLPQNSSNDIFQRFKLGFKQIKFLWKDQKTLWH